MVSEPHYHTGKIFSKNLIAIEMKQKTNKQTNKQTKKTQIFIDKLVCIGLSI